MTWYRDSWRHALSARGIANRRYSYAFIMNSRKGNRSNPFDIKVINPKTGLPVDLKKSLQARGIKTTGGRDYRRVGDQFVPEGTPVLAPEGPTVMPFSSLTESELIPLPSSEFNIPMEGTMPTVPTSYGFGTASPTVEGGPPIEEVSTTLPGSQLAGAVIPELVEGKEVSKEGLVEVSGIGTTDAFEPSPLDSEMH